MGLRIDPKAFLGPTQIGKQLCFWLLCCPMPNLNLSGWVGGWVVVIIENIAISASSLGLGLGWAWQYFLGKLSSCQAKPKLVAEMAIFSIVSTTHSPIHSSAHPSTHPDKFEFGIGQHNSQKQSCLSSWVGSINAFGSILCPIIANLDQHQA